MAWTQTQLDALDQAISLGALKVKYADKEVTYNSLDEMLRLRKMMRDELGLNSSSSGSSLRRYPTFSKGTKP